MKERLLHCGGSVSRAEFHIPSLTSLWGLPRVSDLGGPNGGGHLQGRGVGKPWGHVSHLSPSALAG